MAISRRLAGLALSIALLPGAVPVGALNVDVAALRSARGTLRICLTRDPQNFPNCVDDRAAITRSAPASGGAVRFVAVPYGDYALAVVHDENSNGKLDTFAGIPREGIGFSRNPRITFGPPRFTAAEFAIGGAGEAQRVKMRYFL